MNLSDEKERPRSEVFDSAIDSWVAFLLFLGPGIAAAMGMYLLALGEPGQASTLFATAAVTLIVTLGLTLPCRYKIGDDVLSIRCGLIAYKIPLDQIRSVEPTASLRSGPALSLRRVAVETERKKHILSPKHRDEFIDRMNAVLSATKPEN